MATNREQVAFELENPSGFVTQSSEIGYGGTPAACGLIYDISVANAVHNVPVKYESLSAALGINGANIPQDIRRGGMSIKFIQSSDNKYVQYRYIGAVTEGSSDPFVDVHNWKGADDSIKYLIVEHVNSYAEAISGSYYTEDLISINYKVNENVAYRVYPNPQNTSASFAISGNEVYLIDNDKYVFMNDVLMKMSREIVNNLTSGGTEKGLSAEQGKVLKNQIDGCCDLTVLNSMNPTIEDGYYSIVNNVITKNNVAQFNCCKVDVSNIKFVVASFCLEASWGAKSCFADNNDTVISTILGDGNKNIYNVPEGSKWLYISNYQPSSNRLIVAVPNKSLDARVIRYNEELSVYDNLYMFNAKKANGTLEIRNGKAEEFVSNIFKKGTKVKISASDTTLKYRVNRTKPDGTNAQSGDLYGVTELFLDYDCRVSVYNNSTSSNTFNFNIVEDNGIIVDIRTLCDKEFVRELTSGKGITYVVSNGFTLHLMAEDEFGNLLGYLDKYGKLSEEPVSIGSKTIVNRTGAPVIVVPIVSKYGDYYNVDKDVLTITEAKESSSSIFFAKYNISLQNNISISEIPNGDRFEIDIMYTTDYTTVPSNIVTVNTIRRDGGTSLVKSLSMEKGDCERIIVEKQVGDEYISITADDLTRLFVCIRKCSDYSASSNLSTDIPNNPYPVVLGSSVGILPTNTAAENTLAFNNAVSTHHNILIDIPGVYEIATPVNYVDDCRIEFVEGCILKKTQEGSIFYNVDRIEKKNVAIIGNGLIIDTNGYESMHGTLDSGTTKYLAQIQIEETKGFYISGIRCNWNSQLYTSKKSMYFFIAISSEDIVCYDMYIHYPKDGLDFSNCKNILIDTYDSATSDDPFFFGNGWAQFFDIVPTGVQNVVVKNWINRENPLSPGSSYTSRLMTHSWDDWTSGRKYGGVGVGDGAEMCLNNSILYVCMGAPTDGNDEVIPSTVPPIHSSGEETYSDGYTWKALNSDIPVNWYSGDITNVVFENCTCNFSVVTSAYCDFTIEPNTHQSVIEWSLIDVKGSMSRPLITVAGCQGKYDITLKNVFCCKNYLTRISKEQRDYLFTNKMEININILDCIYGASEGGDLFRVPYNTTDTCNAYKSININNSAIVLMSGSIFNSMYSPNVVRMIGSYIRCNRLRSSAYSNTCSYYIADCIINQINANAVFFATNNEQYKVYLFCQDVCWLNDNITSSAPNWYILNVSNSGIVAEIAISGIVFSPMYDINDVSLLANITSNGIERCDLLKAKQWWSKYQW